MTAIGSSIRLPTLRLVPDQGLYALMLTATIAFWLVGLLTLAQAVVIGLLAFSRAPSGILVRVVALGWIAIGVAQLAASILAGVWLDQPGEGFAQLASFGVMGWVLAGLAIWAGGAHRLSDPPIVRAISILGLFVIGLATIGAVGVVLGQPALYSPYTLPLMLAPNSVSARLYGSVAIYISEETLGELKTRLILFYPYTTALGLGGIGITLISLLEKDWRFRLCGIAGGLIAVVFSWSRISLGALVICAFGWCWLKASMTWRLVFVGLALVTLFVLSVADVNWPGAIGEIQARIDGVRAGSSLARQLIYEKSWEGFLQSPIFGHGWIGPSVHPKEMLPIGSHSTVYGLLYTGGLLTFGTFVLALAMTLVAGLFKLLTVSADRRDEIIVMILLSGTLLVFCKYESLFSVTLPCSYIFAFIGGALATPGQQEAAAPPKPSSREQRFHHERS